MLTFESISAGYDGRAVLRDVDLTVHDGEVVGLVGPNGCGKTTLLRVASGVLTPIEGCVRLNGVDVQKIGRRRLARSMACLSQEMSLNLPFTVREVTLMGRAPHLPRVGAETQRDWEIVERAMVMTETVDLAHRPITELSGGERQRAFIAMCLAQEPQVLLLDEPTSHLDIGHQLSTLELIGRLKRQTGLTVVSVFHDLNLASEYCDRLVILSRGRLERIGSPQEVLTTDMIFKVYGVRIHVQPNPVSHKPHIVIAAGTRLDHDAISGKERC